MLTTEGYPYTVEQSDFNLPRIVAAVSFLLGILSLSTLIGLSGWTKSKGMGMLTTIVGILTFVAILIVSS